MIKYFFNYKISFAFKLFLLAFPLSCISTVHAVDDPTGENRIPQLPAEVWKMIFDEAPLGQLPKISRICKDFQEMVEPDWIEGVEKELEEFDELYRKIFRLYNADKEIKAQNRRLNTMQHPSFEEEVEGEFLTFFDLQCALSRLLFYYHILWNDVWSGGIPSDSLGERKRNLLLDILGRARQNYDLVIRYKIGDSELRKELKCLNHQQLTSFDLIVRVLGYSLLEDVRDLIYDSTSTKSGADAFKEAMQLLREEYQLPEVIALRVLVFRELGLIDGNDEVFHGKYMDALFSRESILRSKDVREALAHQISLINTGRDADKNIPCDRLLGIWPEDDPMGKMWVMMYCSGLEDDGEYIDRYQGFLVDYKISTQLALQMIEKCKNEKIKGSTLSGLSGAYDPVREGNDMEPDEFFEKVFLLTLKLENSGWRLEVYKNIFSDKKFILSHHFDSVYKAIEELGEKKRKGLLYKLFKEQVKLDLVKSEELFSKLSHLIGEQEREKIRKLFIGESDTKRVRVAQHKEEGIVPLSLQPTPLTIKVQPSSDPMEERDKDNKRKRDEGNEKEKGESVARV